MCAKHLSGCAATVLSPDLKDPSSLRGSNRANLGSSCQAFHWRRPASEPCWILLDRSSFQVKIRKWFDADKSCERMLRVLTATFAEKMDSNSVLFALRLVSFLLMPYQCTAESLFIEFVTYPRSS